MCAHSSSKLSSNKKPRLGQVSLERALSKLGIASRTQANAMIVSGRVRVNGVIQKNPRHFLNPERSKIEVDGLSVKKSAFLAYLLYKPKNVVTTRQDEKGRVTVFSLIKESDSHLIAVGRLDFATTGLLLITNHTQLAAWLTDPLNQVPRTYLVSVRGKIEPETLSALQDGIVDKGETLSAEQISIRKSSGKETHLTVTLTEGKNREIRRMFSSQGHEVTKLKRVAFGALNLGELKPSEYRALTIEELKRAFPKAAHLFAHIKIRLNG